METAPIGLLGASQKTIEAAVGLANNFTDFLTLLTTQLQNQDPLKPLDATQFTTQLVQFANVEQAIGQNARLDEILRTEGANQAVGAVAFLNSMIEAFGDTTILTDGTAEFAYRLPSDAKSVNITIKNAAGDVVRTLTGDLTAGKHKITWDGKNNQGVLQPGGEYTIAVAASDANDASMNVITSIFGTVNGITVKEGALVLDLGGHTVKIGDVVSVKKAGSTL
jgi:flagellar basal-body rod modification protein FlgD